MTRVVMLLALALIIATPLLAQVPLEPKPGEIPDSPHPWRIWESQARIAALEAKAAARGLGDPVPGQLDYDVRFYDLDLDIDPDAEMLTGTVTVRATVVEDTLDQLVLNMIRILTVDAVRAGGTSTSFDHPLDHLTIDLDRTYTVGETVEVAVDYHGDPADAGSGFGWSWASGRKLVWTLSEPYGARNWWPCKDFNFDKADSVDLHVTVPEPYVVASNGLLVSQDSAGGQTTYHWEERYPICTYLVSVTAYPYVVFSDDYIAIDGSTMPVENYVIPEYEQDARDGYAITPDIITAFREGFGEYPFLDEKYGHAHFTWAGGMEHQTCTSMLYWYYGQGIIAHELAHQWWGDLVTCFDFHHIWLNEGFATWSEAYWREHSEGMAAYHDEMEDAEYRGEGTIYVENPDNFSTIFDVNLSYNKASWVVHMLRGILGDEEFFDGLALYRERFAYSSATTEEFQQVMEDISGRDLESFFQQWIYGEYFPRYRFSYTLTPEGGDTRAQVRIEQFQAVDVFDMPIRLRILNPSGDEDIVLENNRRVQNYSFLAPYGTTSLQLDPDHWILRDVVPGVTTSTPTVADGFSLDAYPNPFNPRTTLRLELPTAGDVRLDLFDARGRLVRTLLDEDVPAGSREVVWDGFDAGGRAVSAGIYFAIAETTTGSRTTRLTLVR